MSRETAYGQLIQAPRLLVLDLSQLTALDTDGVTLLVEIAYEAGEADIGLCLVIDRTRPDLVTTPLAKANVLALFEIQPTVAAVTTLG
ncbi:MAG: STAS domain-containing protein [Pseudonocardiaceae bacterium]